MAGELVPVYGVVYLITNSVDGKFYVGQTLVTIEKRLESHYKHARNKKNITFLCNAIRKHGIKNFTTECLCVCSNQVELDLMEDLYILSLDALNNQVGYNLRRGGGGGAHSERTKSLWSVNRKGRVMSPEWRNNISKSLKGKPHNLTPEGRASLQKSARGNTYGSFLRTEETRQKMGKREWTPEQRAETGARLSLLKGDVSGENNPFFGKKHTEESLEKMRNKVFSEETREKMSESSAGEKNVKFRHDAPTAEMIRLANEGHSTREIGEILSMDGSSVWRRLDLAGVKTKRKRKRTQADVQPITTTWSPALEARPLRTFVAQPDGDRHMDSEVAT